VIVAGGRVVDSILSPNVRVHDGADVESSILFEDVQVGRGARLRRVIVDKHVRVPANEAIGFDAVSDRARFTVSENGVVVVPRLYAF
jgi:glucose-1-phosphate adenylyltransferase